MGGCVHTTDSPAQRNFTPTNITLPVTKINVNNKNIICRKTNK